MWPFVFRNIQFQKTGLTSKQGSCSKHPRLSLRQKLRWVYNHTRFWHQTSASNSVLYNFIRALFQSIEKGKNVLLRRDLFLFVQLKWTEPDEEALVQFMVQEKGFRCVTKLSVVIFCGNWPILWPLKHCGPHSCSRWSMSSCWSSSLCCSFPSVRWGRPLFHNGWCGMVVTSPSNFVFLMENWVAM